VRKTVAIRSDRRVYPIAMGLPTAQTETSGRAAETLKTREKVRARALEAAPEMLEYLIAAAKGEAPAKRERIDAAKTVLDRAGIVPPQRDNDKPASLAELSPADLAKVGQLLEAEQARRRSESKTIDVTPQRVDIFD
jgi:hypothetical protein